MEPTAPPPTSPATKPHRILHIRNQPIAVQHATPNSPTPAAFASPTSPTSPTSPSGAPLAQYTALPALPPISPGRPLSTTDVEQAVSRAHAFYTNTIKDLVDQAAAVKAVVDTELFGAEFAAGQAEIKALRLALEDTQQALAREKEERKQEGAAATLRFGEEESEVARLREAFLASQDEAEDALAAAKKQHQIDIAVEKAKLVAAHEEHASAQETLHAQYEAQTQELLDHIEQLNSVLDVAQQQPKKRLSIAFDAYGNRQIYQNEP